MIGMVLPSFVYNIFIFFVKKKIKFRELLLNAKRNTVWDIAYLRIGEHVGKERNKFLNKMNQVYCNIETIDELDDGTIDFKVKNRLFS